MLRIKLGRCVRALAFVVAFTAFGGAPGLAATTAQGAIVRTCQGGGAHYTVTVPQNAGSTAGVDPYETRAINCTIGYQEKKGFPLSLIGVCLIATAATLILLVMKKDALDLPGGRAFDTGEPGVNVTGGDA